MNNIDRLVRHPAAHPTESLYGYILRLVEENGYMSLWQLFSLANIPARKTVVARISIASLAAITNRSEHALEPISYRSSGMSVHHSHLLAHPILVKDLGLKRPRICPECLAQKGFIEAHFDLMLMTGCPVHRKILLSACPKCSQALRWSRPGLLTCQCGASLADLGGASVSSAETDLLDILRRKVLGLPVESLSSSGLPLRDLQALSVRNLLKLIAALGMRKTKMNRKRNEADCQRLVNSAATMLSDWPKNFFQFLEGLGDPVPGSAVSKLTRDPKRLFRSFTKNGIKPMEHADFLRVALTNFSEEHGGFGLRDKELLQRAGTNCPKRFIVKAEFARRYRITPRAAARYLGTGGVPSVQIKYGSSKRSLIDSEAITLTSRSPGTIYGSEKAAVMIGTTVKILELLKAGGDFEVGHIPQGMRGYHELDIQAFSGKLKALTPAKATTGQLSQNLISFEQIAKGHYGGSSMTKADIIRRMLSRELPVVGCIDGTVGGLLVSEQALRDCSCKAFPLHEAARQLHCDRKSISVFVELGVLRCLPKRSHLWIIKESILEFLEHYVPIALIAKMTGSNSPALVKRCKKLDIQLFAVRTSEQISRKTFIRVENHQALLSYLSNEAQPFVIAYTGQ